MKSLRFCLFIFVILVLSFPLGCAKKAIYTDATPYTPVVDKPGGTETQPPGSSDSKAGTPGDQMAALERDKRIKEEAVREEDLRAKALREEALKKEATAREAALKELKLETIFFDYNQWVIREDQRELMTRNAEIIKAHPNIRVLLEGNCDERGTAEYNLALGQKRAEAAKAFLVGLGLDAGRTKTISYGFERPSDPGHNEEAWAKNRRVDFVTTK